MLSLRSAMLAVALPWMLAAVVCAADPPAGNWHTDVDKAFQQSQATGKPLLLFFTSDNCQFCQQMKRETLSNPNIKLALDQAFIPVLVHKSDNENFVEKLGVRSFPTTMIVSPEAKIRDIIGGYVGPRDLQARLVASLRTPTRK